MRYVNNELYQKEAMDLGSFKGIIRPVMSMTNDPGHYAIIPLGQEWENLRGLSPFCLKRSIN